jgi:hypothetical protein
VAADLDALIDRIRRLPGFERFLLPPPTAALVAAASNGPVVLVNVAPLRADALVLTATGVDVVPLGDVGPAAVVEQLERFLAALATAQDAASAAGADGRDRAEAAIGAVLGWLWDRITGPVLGRLGITCTPGGRHGVAARLVVPGWAGRDAAATRFGAP